MLLLVFVYLTPPPRDFALPPSDDDLVAQFVVTIDRLAGLDAPVGGQDWLWRDRGSLRTVCGRCRRRSFRFRTAVMPVVVMVVVMVTVPVPVMSRLSRRGRGNSSSRSRSLWRRAVLLVGIQVDPRIDRHCASRRDEPVHLGERRRRYSSSCLVVRVQTRLLLVLVEEERCGGELDAASSSCAKGGGRGRSRRGRRSCLLPARVAARRAARIAASSGRRRRRSGRSDSGRRRHGARGHQRAARRERQRWKAVYGRAHDSLRLAEWLLHCATRCPAPTWASLRKRGRFTNHRITTTLNYTHYTLTPAQVISRFKHARSYGYI